MLERSPFRRPPTRDGARRGWRLRFTTRDTKAVTACEATVFPMLVKSQSEVWPEREQRETQWVAPGKAVELVGEPDLKTLIAAFARRVAAAASRLAF